MNARTPKPLSPPTMPERAEAAKAACALRDVLSGRSIAGEQSVMHLDYTRPRRSEWITTWANLPGFSRVNDVFRHACLPGWEYARSEIKPEMIPDLEALAEHGVRPTEVTSAA